MVTIFDQKFVHRWLDRLVSRAVDPRQSILITGFWRSGTTWLQESLARHLGSKTVFEPFHACVPGVSPLYQGAIPCLWAMPYCPSPSHDRAPAIGHQLQQALRSSTPGSWVRYLRSGPTESFRRSVIVKVARGHLCLGGFRHSIESPWLHIQRDPRALVASFKRWDTSGLLLEPLLLAVPDGRAEYFSQWRSDILRIDQMGMAARVAGYWALTERFFAESLARQQAQVETLQYEDLCVDGWKALSPALHRLGIQGSHPMQLTKPSSLSPSQLTPLNPAERTDGWRTVLSKEEIQSVEAIARQFGLDNRLRP